MANCKLKELSNIWLKVTFRFSEILRAFVNVIIIITIIIVVVSRNKPANRSITTSYNRYKFSTTKRGAMLAKVRSVGSGSADKEVSSD